MNKAEVFEEKLPEFCFGGKKAYSSRRSYSSVAEMNDSNIGYCTEKQLLSHTSLSFRLIMADSGKHYTERQA